MDAISRGDGIGVLESLAPAERDAFRDGVSTVSDELQRLGVLNPMSLSNIPGVTVEIHDVVYHSDKLADEVVRVTMASGTIAINTRADGFPLPEHTQRWLDRDFGARVDPNSSARVIDLSRSRPSLVAVKESGGWHVSLYYTLAEQVRGPTGGPMPRFGEGPAPVGGDTPLAASRTFIEAAASLDAARAVTVVYPTEGRAFYDYSSLLLPLARRHAQALAKEDLFSIDVAALEMAESGEGTSRLVSVTSAEIKVSDGDDRLEMRYGQGCVSERRFMSGNDREIEESNWCDGSLAPTSRHRDPNSHIDQVTSWQDLGRAFPTFVVLERQGRWYVSPTRTVLWTFGEILHHLQPADTDALSDRLGDLWKTYLPS